MSVINPDAALLLNSEHSLDTWAFQGTWDTKCSQYFNCCSRFLQKLCRIPSNQHGPPCLTPICISQRAFLGFMLENESMQHLKGLGCRSLWLRSFSFSTGTTLERMQRPFFFLQQFKVSAKQSPQKVKCVFVAANHVFRQDKTMSTKVKELWAIILYNPYGTLYSIYKI